jgi:hypothetical protein
LERIPETRLLPTETHRELVRNFVLLDEEEAQGKLDQVGDEITFVQAIRADSFERADFTFFPRRRI